ncbi:unnamed protein product [Plutella xylostella]|uniref:Fatty acyl-CoA reductase n=1 Tax=Plutella xylostella TaxID=51655 RepID=A0A8S4FZ26_PLUXY|nr:unnamed protein product [Plutella xylostella]
MPKLTYALRTSPVWLFPANIVNIDNCIKNVLEQVLNIKLEGDQWRQAALPIRHGGLGIRRVKETGLSAFLSSAHGVVDLVTRILSINGDGFRLPFVTEALEGWEAQCPGKELPDHLDVQKAWDDVLCKSVLDKIMESSIGVDLARVRASSKPESGSWLHALPSPQMGTLLDDDSLRIAVALRLGCDICEQHHCICGALVDSRGHHGLSYPKCAGRFPRHHALNDLIKRAMVMANIPCVLEPPGLSRTDGKRPDGLTLVPWERGRSLLWDATCVSTFAASHLAGTARVAGSAAENAARLKHQKYTDLKNRYLFVPVAVETSGVWGGEAKALIRDLGRRIASRGHDRRSGSYLAQRLSLAIQRACYADDDDVLHGMTKIVNTEFYRSCRDIKKIYLLSRDKKGKSMEERLKKTLEDPVFEEARKVNPYFEKRLVPVAGDVAELRLGLSDEDWNMLAEEVNYIYHIAATVRFDEPLKVAILTNARGTREVITLAKETKNLKTFVHVSTAYSNCYNEETFEKFYPTPVSAQTIIDLCETFDEDRLEAITPHILGGWPNTYSFSKAIAEEAVRTYATDIPTCVVRPGSVVPTACEPAPGWLDISNVSGPSGFVLGTATGVIHTSLVNPDAKHDIVPVDYVTNLTIAATWDTVQRYENGHRDIKIYTVSNIRNFVSWRVYRDVLETEGRKLVSPKAIWYCGTVEAYNEYTYFLLSLFLHFIPAFFVDIVLKLRGSKFRLLKIYKRVYKLNTIVSFFLLRPFRLHDDNTLDLFNRLSDTDRTIFNFDVADIDFNVYVKYWWLGLRKYIIKDGLKGTDEAVRKQKWLKEVQMPQILPLTGGPKMEGASVDALSKHGAEVSKTSCEPLDLTGARLKVQPKIGGNGGR